MVEAYGNLAADGYLEARQGAGTRVRADAQAERRGSGATGHAHDTAAFFLRPRQASPDGAPPVRLIGGLPDPALFPRAKWVGHYRAALAELPDPGADLSQHAGRRALCGSP